MSLATSIAEARAAGKEEDSFWLLIVWGIPETSSHFGRELIAAFSGTKKR
jgi:hypothetical protein